MLTPQKEVPLPSGDPTQPPKHLERLSYDATGIALTERSPRGIDNRHVSSDSDGKPIPQEDDMGKYVLAWLLGVPAFVLVIVYMLAH